MRFSVCRKDAWRYVAAPAQPTLAVHDLKHGAVGHGSVLLWVGPGTVSKFRNVRVHPLTPCNTAAPENRSGEIVGI